MNDNSKLPEDEIFPDECPPCDAEDVQLWIAEKQQRRKLAVLCFVSGFICGGAALWVFQ